MNSDIQVALLGLGRMGAVMATHLVDAGHAVTTWNRSPGKSVDGARPCATPGEAVQGADVVLTMLFDGDSVAAVLFDDEDAVAGSAKPGTLVIDCTTVGPDAARELHAKAAAAGLRYVEAPVGGAVPALEKKNVAVFLGGDEKDVVEALPFVALWADPDRIFQLGEIGMGNSLKVVVNVGLGLAIVGIGESMALGRDLGLQRGDVLKALSAGPFSFTLGQKKDAIASGDYSTPTFSLDALAKDVGLAVGKARHDLGSMLATDAAAQAALAAGHGGDDYAVLAGYVADEGRAGSQ